MGCFLDDADLVLVGRRRGEHMRLRFALQLVTMRWLGTLLKDPVDVTAVVLDFVADQLDVTDSLRVNEYTVTETLPPSRAERPEVFDELTKNGPAALFRQLPRPRHPGEDARDYKGHGVNTDCEHGEV
ncbi:DUF4158 domain-containing protein [Cryobacterium serini]|uniref:DUF4158 domain-containing protein n=1 Tax=Cryobacterium serini TaxID=1259201 RepID=A0A4R9BNS3_9MICO|nr:DUF4158 domain-containing protein [Cryobacterium serini]